MCMFQMFLLLLISGNKTVAIWFSVVFSAKVSKKCFLKLSVYLNFGKNLNFAKILLSLFGVRWVDLRKETTLFPLKAEKSLMNKWYKILIKILLKIYLKFTKSYFSWHFRFHELWNKSLMNMARWLTFLSIYSDGFQSKWFNAQTFFYDVQ